MDGDSPGAAGARGGGSGEVTSSQIVQNVVFILIAAVIIVGAVRVVTAQNVVHAALYLVLTLGATAALFVLLVAEFVAWVQVLIYVGAIVVLFLFGVMLTRAPIGKNPDLDNTSIRPWAAVAGLMFLAAVAIVLWRHFASLPPLELVAPEGSQVQEIGRQFLVTWVVPFEAVSMVLLAALIGALAMARKD